MRLKIMHLIVLGRLSYRNSKTKWQESSSVKKIFKICWMISEQPVT